MLLPKTAAARIISCDVFDTLLYRDHRSERQRFNDIAVLAAQRLAAERGIVRHPGAIYDARLDVQKQAYRALDLSCPTGDVRFADMIDAMARILSLDAQAAEILHHAEIAIEIAQLTANTVLLDWLRAQARTGCRIIAVSDTYHRGETIAQLLAARAPDHPSPRSMPAPTTTRPSAPVPCSRSCCARKASRPPISCISATIPKRM